MMKTLCVGQLVKVKAKVIRLGEANEVLANQWSHIIEDSKNPL